MRAALIVIPLLLAACAVDPAAQSYSVGDFCKETSDAFCDRRWDACPNPDPEPTRLECVTGYVALCCSLLGACVDEGVVTADEAMTCAADLRNFPCDLLAQGSRPVSCLAP